MSASSMSSFAGQAVKPNAHQKRPTASRRSLTTVAAASQPADSVNHKISAVAAAAMQKAVKQKRRSSKTADETKKGYCYSILKKNGRENWTEDSAANAATAAAVSSLAQNGSTSTVPPPTNGNPPARTPRARIPGQERAPEPSSSAADGDGDDLLGYVVVAALDQMETSLNAIKSDQGEIGSLAEQVKALEAQVRSLQDGNNAAMNGINAINARAAMPPPAMPPPPTPAPPPPPPPQIIQQIVEAPGGMTEDQLAEQAKLKTALEVIESKVGMHWKSLSQQVTELTEEQRAIARSVAEGKTEVLKSKEANDEMLKEVVKKAALTTSRVDKVEGGLDTLDSKVTMHWKWGSKAATEVQETHSALTQEISRLRKEMAQLVTTEQTERAIVSKQTTANAGQIASLNSALDAIDTKVKLHWKHSSAAQEKLESSQDSLEKALLASEGVNAKLQEQLADQVSKVGVLSDRVDKSASAFQVGMLGSKVEVMESKVGMYWKGSSKTNAEIAEDVTETKKALKEMSVKLAAESEARASKDAELEGEVDEVAGKVAPLGDKIDTVDSKVGMHWKAASKSNVDAADAVAANKKRVEEIAARVAAESEARAAKDAELEGEVGEVAGKVAPLAGKIDTVSSQVGMHWKHASKATTEASEAVLASKKEVKEIAARLAKETEERAAKDAELEGEVGEVAGKVAPLGDKIDTVASQVGMHWKHASKATADLADQLSGNKKILADMQAKIAAESEARASKDSELEGIVAPLADMVGPLAGKIDSVDSKVGMHWKQSSKTAADAAADALEAKRAAKEVKKQLAEEAAARASADEEIAGGLDAVEDQVAPMSGALDSLMSKVGMHWKASSLAAAETAEDALEAKKAAKEVAARLAAESEARASRDAELEGEVDEVAGKVAPLGDKIDTVDSKVNMHWKANSTLATEANDAALEAKKGVKELSKKVDEQAASQEAAYAGLAGAIAAGDTRLSKFLGNLEVAESKIAMHWKESSRNADELMCAITDAKVSADEVKAQIAAEAEARAAGDAALEGEVGDVARKVGPLPDKIDTVASQVSMHWKANSTASTEATEAALAAEKEVEELKKRIAAEAEQRAAKDEELEGDVDEVSSMFGPLVSYVETIDSKVGMHWKQSSLTAAEAAEDALEAKKAAKEVAARLAAESEARASRDAELEGEVDAVSAVFGPLAGKVDSIESKVGMHWKASSLTAAEAAEDALEAKKAAKEVAARLAAESEARASKDAELEGEVDEVAGKVAPLGDKIDTVASQVSMHWKANSTLATEANEAALKAKKDIQEMKKRIAEESLTRASFDEDLAAKDAELEGIVAPLAGKIDAVDSKVGMHWKQSSLTAAETAEDALEAKKAAKEVAARLAAESEARASKDAELEGEVGEVSAVFGPLAGKVDSIESKVGMHWKSSSKTAAETADDALAAKKAAKELEAKLAKEADVRASKDAEIEAEVSKVSKLFGPIPDKIASVASQVSMHWKANSKATTEANEAALAAKKEVKDMKKRLAEESLTRASFDEELAAKDAELEDIVGPLAGKIDSVDSKVGMHWKQSSKTAAETADDALEAKRAAKEVKKQLAEEAAARASGDEEIAGEVRRMGGKLGPIGGLVQMLESKVGMHWKESSKNAAEVGGDVAKTKKALEEVERRIAAEAAARAAKDAELEGEVDEVERKVGPLPDKIDSVASQVGMHWKHASKAVEEASGEVAKTKKALEAIERQIAAEAGERAAKDAELEGEVDEMADMVGPLAGKIDAVDSKVGMHWKAASKIAADAAEDAAQAKKEVTSFGRSVDGRIRAIESSAASAAAAGDRSSAMVGKLATNVEVLESKVSMHWRQIGRDMVHLEEEQKNLYEALAANRAAAADAAQQAVDAELAVDRMHDNFTGLENKAARMAMNTEALDSKVGMHWKHVSDLLDSIASTAVSQGKSLDANRVEQVEMAAELHREVEELVGLVSNDAREAASFKERMGAQLEVIESKLRMHWLQNSRHIADLEANFVGSKTGLATEKAKQDAEIVGLEEAVAAIRGDMAKVDAASRSVGGMIEILESKVGMHWRQLSPRIEALTLGMEDHEALLASGASDDELKELEEEMYKLLQGVTSNVGSLQRGMDKVRGTMEVLDSKVAMHWKQSGKDLVRIEEDITASLQANTLELQESETRLAKLEPWVGTVEDFMGETRAAREGLESALHVLESSGNIRWQHTGEEIDSTNTRVDGLERDVDELKDQSDVDVGVIKSALDGLESAIEHAQGATSNANQTLGAVRTALAEDARGPVSEVSLPDAGELVRSSEGIRAAKSSLQAIRERLNSNKEYNEQELASLRENIANVKGQVEDSLSTVVDQMTTMESNVVDNVGGQKIPDGGKNW